MNEQIEQIREKIINHNLTINRIPLNTLKRFKEIANKDDFCAEYGMVIKYLIDFHDGLILDPNEKLYTEIEQLKLQMNALFTQFENLREQNEQEKKRKLLSGKGVE